MKKISLMISTLIIAIVSLGTVCTAFGAETVHGNMRNLYAEVSNTKTLARYVTVDIRSVYYNQYKGVDLTYYWDCGSGSNNERGTSSHTYTKNGNYTVKVYTYDDNHAEHLEETLYIVINNIDNTVPQIGDIDGDLTQGKWNITLKNCTDNISPASALKSMCLPVDQASGFRQGSGWDDDRLRTEGSWTNSMTYTKDEGHYCIFLMDEAGNINEADYDTGHLDVSAPEFTGDPLIENEGGDGSYTHAVLITVNATDNEKLNAYPYSFNGGNTWQEGSQLRVVENGVYQVKARDASGNESDTLEIEINNIDNEAPEISLSESDGNTENGSVTININASDSLSGVSELSYMNDTVGIPVVIAGGDGSAEMSRGTSITINQNGSYTFFASDLLGNTDSAHINVVKAVKTEYRDPGNNASNGDSTGNNKNENKDNSSSKNNKNKDSKKSDDKKNSSDTGKTTIINPGTAPKDPAPSAVTNPAGTGNDSRTVIKDSGSSTVEKDSSKSNDKSSGNSKNRTITVSAPGTGKTGLTGQKTYSLYDDGSYGYDGSGSPSEGSSEESSESSTEGDGPEIREVTLDEYLSGPDDEDVHEEEISPELLPEKGEDSKNENGSAGKILMTLMILAILAVLTLLLLIAKGIIKIPGDDPDDETDEPGDTCDLSIFDRIKGALTK